MGGADEKWKLAGKLPKICEGFLNMQAQTFEGRNSALSGCRPIGDFDKPGRQINQIFWVLRISQSLQKNRIFRI